MAFKTDWEDGEVLYSAQLNENFEYLEPAITETTNLLIGLTPTISGTYTSPTNAFDGNHTTYATCSATSYGAESYATYDLGSVLYDLNIMYNVFVEFTGICYNNFCYIEISDDNTSWTQIATAQGGQISNPPDVTLQDIKTGYKARYIRLRTLGATAGGAVYDGDTIASVYQLKVVERL